MTIVVRVPILCSKRASLTTIRPIFGCGQWVDGNNRSCSWHGSTSWRPGCRFCEERLTVNYGFGQLTSSDGNNKIGSQDNRYLGKSPSKEETTKESKNRQPSKQLLHCMWSCQISDIPWFSMGQRYCCPFFAWGRINQTIIRFIFYCICVVHTKSRLEVAMPKCWCRFAANAYINAKESLLIIVIINTPRLRNCWCCEIPFVFWSTGCPLNKL